MENDANSVVDTVENVQDTNSQEINKGTQENGNSINPTLESVTQAVDYQKKFSESSKEAQRLYEENKALKEALESKETQTTDNLYPGFEELDEDAKNNLIAYTNTVTSKAAETLKKDPAYAFAIKQYNETVWNNALQETISKYPELEKTKDEFKSKYFNVNNVPENIGEILGDIAKIHLFDKAKEMGAKEAEELNKRVELERTTSGIRETNTVNRSLEDWQRMASENPAQFAKMREQFNSDMASGKI